MHLGEKRASCVTSLAHQVGFRRASGACSAETHVAHEDDVEAGARGGDKDPARRLVELMAEPRSRDKWERRRRRAIVFSIVSVLLAVLVAGVLLVAFDRGFIR